MYIYDISIHLCKDLKRSKKEGVKCGEKITNSKNPKNTRLHV